MPPEVNRTVIETDMSTADEMVKMVFGPLQQLHLTRTKKESLFDMWRSLVRASSTSSEVYTLKRAVLVAGCFPHVKAHPDFPILCVPLGPDDLEPTGAPDASRVAWFQCALSLHIDPPVWDLDDELGELKDPPAVCRVSVRVSNLVFKEFLDASDVQSFSSAHKAVHFGLHNDPLRTRPEMDAFVRSFRFMAGFFHCSVPSPEESVWFDLMHSRVAKNIFTLQLPYLLRMASEAYALPEALRQRVYTLQQSEVDHFSYPPGIDPSACIGLYSATYQLTFATEKGRATLAGRELWPAVPSVFSALLEHPPPGCNAMLAVLNIEFVAAVAEAEILAMYDDNDAMVPPWMNDFVAFFNHL